MEEWAHLSSYNKSPSWWQMWARTRLKGGTKFLPNWVSFVFSVKFLSIDNMLKPKHTIACVQFPELANSPKADTSASVSFGRERAGGLGHIYNIPQENTHSALKSMWLSCGFKPISKIPVPLPIHFHSVTTLSVMEGKLHWKKENWPLRLHTQFQLPKAITKLYVFALCQINVSHLLIYPDLNCAPYLNFMFQMCYFPYSSEPPPPMPLLGHSEHTSQLKVISQGPTEPSH